MTRAVMLDVDGVLGPGWGKFDPEKVARLNRITDQTGAVIVASTAWRLRYTLRGLRRWLKNNGVKAPVVDKTPRFLTAAWEDRWVEVQAWLSINPGVSSFVILDDIKDFGPLERYHVYTGPLSRGLQEEDVLLAVEILKGG